ncbi:MAG: hypothetical protein HY000_32405 [Planctomycetes bacterium]|nr:hypothetical protein [Planctomycetota bacterium]
MRLAVAETATLAPAAGLAAGEVLPVPAGVLPAPLTAPPRVGMIGEPRPLAHAKLFQFREAALRSDHCSISHIAVRLQENGYWWISLRADQNPREVPPVEIATPTMTLEEPKQFTEHLLRNQFFVRVHCIGGHGPGTERGLLGTPVMVQLEPAPFWVQRGMPYPLIGTGFHPAVVEFYDLIDRVEVEFFYRLDSSQAQPVVTPAGGVP